VLTAQLRTAATQNEQTQVALAQLNTELLAQKEARARADQQAEAARSQLALVVARTADNAVASRPAPDNKTTLTDAHETSATGATVISAAPVRMADAPATDAVPLPELRTNPDRIRATAAKAAETAAAPNIEPPAPPAPRMHTVRPNETLEFIAKRYYGDPAKWTRIYVANNAQLSDGRSIKPGMQLIIPED
jgi:nucleoid-associated protein YgaU